MTVIQQLHVAKLADFEFLVSTERSQSGKKIALHEYPNSDKRFAEELGVVPPVFEIEAIIHGDLNRRLTFESILTETGTKTLSHPIYGIVEVMVGDYSVSSRNANIGEFRFNLTLYTTRQNLTITASNADTTQVSEKAKEVREAVGAAIVEQYKVPSTVDNIKDSMSKVGDFLDELKDSANALKDTVSDNLASLNASINTYADKITETIMSDGQTVSTMFLSLIDSTLNSVSDLSFLKDVWEKLSSFGEDDSTIPENTVQRQEAADNRRLLNNVVQVISLVGQYESAVYSDIKTDDELIDVQKDISDFFDQIVNTAAEDKNTIASDQTVLSLLYELRNNSRQVFDELLQNVWRVVDLEKQRSTIFLTAYRYYGDIDNLDLLISLNPQVNNAGYNEEIKAVSK